MVEQMEVLQTLEVAVELLMCALEEQQSLIVSSLPEVAEVADVPVVMKVQRPRQVSVEMVALVAVELVQMEMILQLLAV